MKNKIIQIIYDMRHQPVIAWVTVLGTALSIFLILIVVMMQNVSTANFAPESRRDRMLYGKYIDFLSTDGRSSQSGGLSYNTARRLYEGLEGVEQTSYFCDELQDFDLKGTTDNRFSAKVRLCDANFPNIYDYRLLSGRFFTKEEAKAESHVAVVSRSTARRLFNTEEAVGRKFSCNYKSYTVVGIVDDTSLLATMASGDLFIPFPFSDDQYNSESHLSGEVTVALLVKEGVDFTYVRNQVKKRYAEFDTALKPLEQTAVYHEAPFDQATVAGGIGGSNNTPDHETSDNIRHLIYLILLIVPAINLSSMLHSRMSRRVSEIGVRRAYGCTRARIVSDVVVENMLITLVGGLLGMIAAILFALFYDGLFEIEGGTASPALGMILNLNTLGATLLACLVLNLISAAVPAWHAARISPVEAINSNHN